MQKKNICIQGREKKSGTAGSPPNHPGVLPWFSSLQWVENHDSLVCEHGADINQSIPDSNYSDCPETERSLVWSQLCQQSCAHKSETRPLRIQIRALQEQIYYVMRSEMLFPCFMFILAFIFSTPIIFSLQKKKSSYRVLFTRSHYLCPCMGSLEAHHQQMMPS